MSTIFAIVVAVTGWAHPLQAEGPHTIGDKTVEGWITVLRDKTSAYIERAEALRALGMFGAEAKAAVPDLIKAAREGDLRDEALHALVDVGAAPEVVLPLLMDRFIKRGCEHLTGQGTFVYDDRIDRALARIGAPAVPPLLKILNGPDGKMRVCAANILGEIGPPARGAVPALLRAIEHPDPKLDPDVLVLYAIQSLGRIGPDARAAVPSLVGLLDRKNGDFYSYDLFEVVIALDRIGSPPVRKLLDKFLHDADPLVAWQLAWLGPKARDAVGPLRDALTDRRPQVRFSSAVALAHIDPSIKEVVPVLIEALDHLDDEEIDVMEVPKALAWLGPKAKEALPALVRLVKKRTDDSELFEVLVGVDPEGAVCVPVLIEALERKDASVVDAAARSFGLLGPRAQAAVPALSALLSRDFGPRDEEDETDPASSAADSLRRIGPGSKAAVPALIGALKRFRTVHPSGFDEKFNGGTDWRDYLAAAAAARALGALGPEARAAVPALIEVIRRPDNQETHATYPALRGAAALALGRIGPNARPAVPVLRSLMEEKASESGCQAEAVIALYQLAPDGKDVAERWLEKPESRRTYRALGLDGRAMVLGAMGRSSFETDCVISGILDRLNGWFLSTGPRDLDAVTHSEGWLTDLGGYGAAARLAVPWLSDVAANHPNPWARVWAAEALKRIIPTDAR